MKVPGADERARAEVLRACSEVVANAGLHSEIRTLFGLEGFSPADHTEVFALELLPDACIYLSPGAQLGGEPAERLDGFLAAAGIEPIREATSLVKQLVMVADMIDRLLEAPPGSGDSAAMEKVLAAFLFEHVLPWAPVYATATTRLEPRLSSWAGATVGTLAEVAGWLELQSWEMTPSVLDGRVKAAEDASDLVALAASPYLCGTFLTKRILFERAYGVGLAPRIGSRKFIISSLLEQSPAATAVVLREEAEFQGERWAELASAFGVPLTSWADSASAFSASLV
ncbi:MAG: molecular chaperone TorD family protein [Actinomycetota bacterium]|nr:molecular chaperone TorD family protein [Actinomycetota bacterium]